MQRVAILFADFGPYHVARIDALAESLAETGRELIAFRFTEKSAEYGWQSAQPKRAAVVTLSDRPVVGAVAAFRLALSFYRELRKREISAVFLPTYSPLPNLLCFLAAKAAGCRAVLMTESWHGTDGASPPRKLIKHVLVRMFDSALVGGTPHVDYVVAYGMPREKVFTGYDVVDVEAFATRADEVRALQKSGAWRVAGGGREGGTRAEARDLKLEVGSAYATSDSGVTMGQTADGKPAGLASPPQAEEVLMRSLPERFFLNLGRFVEKKNLSTLIAAYGRYCDEWRVTSDESVRQAPAALVLVGEGPLREDLERQARELGLAVRDGMKDPVARGGAEVVFYPFQQADMTPLFFALCEAFVLPSKREEWGLVVNEAMACGAPVIVSKRVGSRFDLVEEGVTGFSFDPDDVDGLAELLGRMAGNEGLRVRLGAAGRKRIEGWKPDRFGREGVRALEASGSKIK